MRKYALQLKNISKTYKDGDSENTVLNNISINVKPLLEHYFQQVAVK